jgi:hypothetical protein
MAACLCIAVAGACSGKSGNGSITLYRAMAGNAASAMGTGGAARMDGAGTTGSTHEPSATTHGSGGEKSTTSTTTAQAMDAGMAKAPADAQVLRPLDAAIMAAPSKDGSAPMPLVGSYALRITQRDTVTVGLVGTASLLTIVLGTAEVAPDPQQQGLNLKVTLCDYRMGSALEKHLTDLVLSIPSAGIGSIHLDPATISISQDSGSMMSWEASELRGTAGWKPASPSDAPPKSPTDPRVMDQDNDGNPGVSVIFTGHDNGTLYLAMLYRWMLSGTVAANGDLTGSTKSMCKEALLGSDQDPLLVTSFERVPDADTTDDTVRFVRQTKSLSCDEVLANKSTLFP